MSPMDAFIHLQLGHTCTRETLSSPSQLFSYIDLPLPLHP